MERGEVLDVTRAAALAETSARRGLGVSQDIVLLRDLGLPHGEQALARLVKDDSVGEGHRQEAREWLAKLREPAYEARAARPTDGEELLLPKVVRDLTSGWSGGWEIENEPSPERFAQARAVLEALLPDQRLAREEPPVWEGKWLEDAEDRPAWLEVHMVLVPLMPDARLVTRERLIWAWYECERLGIDMEATTPEAFAARWAPRIAAHLARRMLEWLWREDCFASWAQDLAMRYHDRNVAVTDATRLLSEATDELVREWRGRERLYPLQRHVVDHVEEARLAMIPRLRDDIADSVFRWLALDSDPGRFADWAVDTAERSSSIWGGGGAVAEEKDEKPPLLPPVPPPRRSLRNPPPRGPTGPVLRGEVLQRRLGLRRRPRAGRRHALWAALPRHGARAYARACEPHVPE